MALALAASTSACTQLTCRLSVLHHPQQCFAGGTREKCCTLSCASSDAARPWLEEPVLLPSLTIANTGFKEGMEKRQKLLPALLYLNPKAGA